jgi:TPR repeat protein
VVEIMKEVLAIVVVLSSFWQVSVGAQTSQKPGLAALLDRAEAGDADAQVQLGTAYAAGDGVAEDDALAVKWFRTAAEKGSAAGEYSLGEMYLTGRGVSSDLAEAAKWVKRAAEHGDARGQFNLAVMYAQGQGVPKNADEAAVWMHKSADQGLAAGEFGLGSMLAHGRGVPQNIAEAAKWYRKAADQGDGPAMNNLAFLLATSSDPEIRDPKEAVAIAQKAVEMDGGEPVYLDTLARAHFEAGNPGLAAEAERRALKLKPDDVSYKEALGRYERSTLKP